MTPLENLHYALGEIVYAIAQADGTIQKEEREKFYAIVAAELRCKNFYFDVSNTIFKILEQENIDTETSYQWGISQIKLNSHYLSPELKATFIKTVEKIAKAYPPVTIEEKNIIDKFKEDIYPLLGDPVYYEKTCPVKFEESEHMN
jgi:uncharacterized tellurite resistance protein B-like protein